MTPRARSDPVLSVQDVSQSFGSLDVLEDISLSLHPGEFVAVVGPNGSGKTTLSRIVAGLIFPTNGHVELYVSADRPVGYLPQDVRFRSTFTIEETLEFYASLLDEDVQIESTLKQTGLRDVRDRRVEALSGGMRQLLGLAQALLGTPPIVVLDEPTIGLDPRMTTQLYEVMTDAVAQEATVFVPTHNLREARRADKIIVLDRGRIAAAGSPDELMAQVDADSLPEVFTTLLGTTPVVQEGQTEGG